MEGQAGITRIICGVFAALVSACLLTCAFVNVAFASELPGGQNEEGTRQYNPLSDLMGGSYIFTDSWLPSESIFEQSWYSPQISVIADTVLAAINADLQRMTNNYLFVINSAVGTIQADLTYIRADIHDIWGDTTLIHGELSSDTRFDTGSNPDTHTLRWYVKNIYSNLNSNIPSIGTNVGLAASRLNTVNQNLDSILSEFRNSNNQSYLSLITNNVYKLPTISDDLKTANTYLSAIRNNFNQTLSSLYDTNQNIYTDVHAIRQNFDATVSSINDSLLDVTTALGSGGYIGTQLASINSNLSTISTTLNHINSAFLNRTYGDRTIPILNVQPMNWYDSDAQNWTRDVRTGINNINTALGSTGAIYSAIAQLSTDVQLLEIPDYSEYIDGIETALGSGGYIGTQLASINNNLATISTTLKHINSAFLDRTYGNNTVPILNVQPMNWYDSNTQNWTMNVRNGINNINTALGNSGAIYTAITQLSADVLSLEIPDYSEYVDGIETALGTGGYIGQQLASINSTLSSINSILKHINSAFLDRTYGNNTVPILNVQPMNWYDSDTQNWTRDIRNYLRSTDDGIELLGSEMETIIELIRNLDLTVNVNIPDNSQDLIGDFDTDAFKTNSDLLIDRVSQLAPFGAITVASAELGILTQVDPIQKPSMEIPFNFSLTNENVVLDLSWLDDAKPLFNFIMEFLFVLMLLTVTMKYVRQEATA